MAANAWRPEIEQSLDGWRLRYNQGVYRRCNSVWPNQLGDKLKLEERIELVEEFYHRWEVRPRFQICPAAQPVDLAEVLAARGYTVDARTAVQIAPLESIQSGAPQKSIYKIEIISRFNQSWFDLYSEVEGLDPPMAAMRRGTLTRIGARAGFALLRMDGVPAAICLGVLERGWVGVFCMVTHTRFRRQAAARSILNALARWGEEHGATQMYLQVMENNTPALALYERAGFERQYQYYYAEGPEG
ncbi:MAG: GNAT family N-acetyltransferase [Chloroflexi bacterium]|nr:GNAT family N-acetyltransferase [Chloroflexota bacterium]